jgi:hypothetical protein
VKRPTRISRGAWFALGASVLLYGGVWTVVHRLRPIHWAGDPELTALVDERERLRDSDDATRDALRRQSEELLRQAWTNETLRALAERLGSAWVWESRDTEPLERHVVLTRVAPRFDEWPAYVALIADLEKQPGLTVESLDIAAEGARRHRRFTRLTIGLRFIVADAAISKAERSAPSRGPLPLAPGERPATPRKVGPVPSLRRPSASAEPPASGPASAPVRPDPPGPRAGAN